YRDLFFLSTGEGLGVNFLRGQNWRATLSVGYDLGRRSADDLGDLHGLDNINPAAKIKLSADYVLSKRFPLVLRGRLDGVRDKTARMLERVGMRLFTMPSAGMFLWADTGADSDALAAAAHEEGFLLTPGSLFSPQQSPSTWTRFNVANCGDPALAPFLARYLDSVPRRPAEAGPGSLDAA
ncbi:hypothetical protein PPH41_09675, partial [Burkholderia gladioli]|nr:hypothetical protein [Burkholderia gladioli]